MAVWKIFVNGRNLRIPSLWAVILMGFNFSSEIYSKLAISMLFFKRHREA